jgi:hypothetical protein
MQRPFYAAAKALFTLILILGFIFGCGKNEPQESPGAAKTPENAAAEIVLFDGTNLDAWQMDKPNGWKIEGDSMTLGEGGYIWTKERFGNFVLDVEFKISKDCNSGVFFRTGDIKDPVQTGMEMQVYDTASHTEMVKNDSGALYDLVAPSTNTMKPAGEWNRAVITCHDSHVTIELNGTRIVTADLDTWTEPHKNPDGTENKFNLALKDFPREGYIGFQDHGSPVWYRNVKIKKL